MLTSKLQNTLGVCGGVHGFHLYDRTTGESIAEFPPEARGLDLETLGLADGFHDLELRYVDEWGVESPEGRAVLRLTIGDGASQAYAAAALVQVRAVAGGHVALTFIVGRLGDAGSVRPPVYEVLVAEAGMGPVAVLLELPAAGRNSFSELVGPFATGRTVQLGVRASDGEPGRRRGEVVWSDVVVADATPPDGAVPLRPAPRFCD